MTEKGAAVMAVAVILLLGAAHAAYGYWTDRIGVKEDFAMVWPVEVEIEEETEEETPEDLAGEKGAGEAELETAEVTGEKAEETVEITEDKESVEDTEPMETANDTETEETEPEP